MKTKVFGFYSSLVIVAVLSRLSPGPEWLPQRCWPTSSTAVLTK